MTILDDMLICTRHRRRVELEELETAFQVRALVQMGADGDTARVFGFSGAERSKVVSLAVRKQLITRGTL